MTKIHTQLLNDCFLLGRFPLSHLLLMKDANYPWFILVPDREAVAEIYQLPEEDQKQLLNESSCLAKFIMHGFKGDKLNVAAIGNIVPQLHLHHVVRFHSDPAWPAPVWGKLPLKPYSESELVSIRAMFKTSDLKDFVLYEEN